MNIPFSDREIVLGSMVAALVALLIFTATTCAHYEGQMTEHEALHHYEHQQKVEAAK